MAKSSTKRAKSAAKQPSEGSIFDHFQEYHPHMGVEGEQKPQEGPDLATLQARIAQLETDNQEKSRRIDQLAAAPAPSTRSEAHSIDPRKMKVDLDGLPDPDLKPEEHRRELATRINSALEARDYAIRTEQQSAAQNADLSNRLWTGFSAAYPQWAEHGEVVGLVAEQVTREIAESGADAQRYLTVNSQGFYERVAAKLNSKFSRLLEDSEEEEEEESPAQRQPRRMGHPQDGEELDLGRTETPSNASAPRGRGEVERKPTGMIEDLQEMQKKLGYI